jgi:hypothetical protein
MSGPKEKKQDPNFSSLPDVTPRREGGEDSLAESSPTDSRSDEKVVVNEHRGSKTVNGPSQTGTGTNEGHSYDEAIIDK